MKLPDDLQALIDAGDAMAGMIDFYHETVKDWESKKRHYLANRPMTVQEAGALAKKNPTPAQAKASRTNGLLGGRKKGGTK